MKTCTKCGEAKALGEFYRHPEGKDGVHPECKHCVKARARLNYSTNKARVQSSVRRYRDANRRKIAARRQAYRAEHGERISEQVRRWHLLNPDRVRAIKRKWDRAHPEACAANQAARRARKRSAEQPSLSTWERQEIAHLYGLRPLISALCGIEMHLDHIVPLSRGGAHSLSNLDFLPARINLAKGNKLNSECTGDVGDFLNGAPTFDQVTYVVRRGGKHSRSR